VTEKDFFFFFSLFNLFTIRNCRLFVTKYPQDYFTGNYGNTGSLLFSMLLYYQKHFLVQKIQSPHLQMYNEFGIPHAKLKYIGLL